MRIQMRDIMMHATNSPRWRRSFGALFHCSMSLSAHSSRWQLFTTPLYGIQAHRHFSFTIHQWRWTMLSIYRSWSAPSYWWRYPCLFCALTTHWCPLRSQMYRCCRWFLYKKSQNYIAAHRIESANRRSSNRDWLKLSKCNESIMSKSWAGQYRWYAEMTISRIFYRIVRQLERGFNRTSAIQIGTATLFTAITISIALKANQVDHNPTSESMNNNRWKLFDGRNILVVYMWQLALVAHKSACVAL